MQVKKEVLLQLQGCYALAYHQFQGVDYCIVASEEKTGCFIINLDTKDQYKVWDDLGGTMTIVPISNETSFIFFATRKFYPGFQAQEAELVKVVFDLKTCKITKIMDFPYLHRFTFFEKDGDLHFIGCTLAKHKSSISDWSQPGAIWTGIYDEKCGLSNLTVLQEGLTKNHGFVRGAYKSKTGFYVSAEEGVYFANLEAEWSIQQVLHIPVSEISVVSFQKEASPCFVTIEPFHGNTLHVIQDDQIIFTWTNDFQFGHVNTASFLLKKPCVIIGSRQGNQALQMLTFENEIFKIEDIDIGGGPANIVINENKQELIATNGATGEVVLYQLEEN